MADALDDAHALFAQKEQIWLDARAQYMQIRSRGDALSAQLSALTPLDHADSQFTEELYRKLETSIADAQRAMRIERAAYQDLVYAERTYKELELSWCSTALSTFQARRRGGNSFSEVSRG
jgi:hypothetical protein